MSIKDKAQTLRNDDHAILAGLPDSVKAVFQRECKAHSMAAEMKDRLKSIPDHATALEQAMVYVYEDAAAVVVVPA